MIQTNALPPDVEATIERLMKLPPDQRIEVGERLLASIPPDVSDFWEREIARRIEDHEAGRTQSYAAHDVVARLRQRIEEATQQMRESAPIRLSWNPVR